MKNINDLKKTEKVILNFLEREYTVLDIDKKVGKVLLDVGLPAERFPIKNIFPATNFVKEISTLIREEQSKIISHSIGNICIDTKITREMFVSYWTEMCESEDEPSHLEFLKTKFSNFIAAIKSRIGIMQNLEIDGITFIYPMLFQTNEEK